MKRGAVLFDRDGTLNVDLEYVFRVEDLRWMPGAVEAVAEVNRRGLLAIVITNQSGIGRGMYGEAELDLFHAAMSAELATAGAHVDGWYFCPYHPEAAVERYRHPDHPDRKPNPGLVLRALADFDLDPARCLMVGDNKRDIEAGERAGVRGVLYREGRLDELVTRALDAG